MAALYLGVMFNCTTKNETVGIKKEKNHEFNLFHGTERTNLNIQGILSQLSAVYSYSWGLMCYTHAHVFLRHWIFTWRIDVQNILWSAYVTDYPKPLHSVSEIAFLLCRTLNLLLHSPLSVSAHSTLSTGALIFVTSYCYLCPRHLLILWLQQLEVMATLLYSKLSPSLLSSFLICAQFTDENPTL